MNNQEPFEHFQELYVKAQQLEKDASVMVLSTIGKDTFPHSRCVLLKNFNPQEGCFLFFTNYASAKAKNLDHNANASLLFYWETLGIQIRITGVVRIVPPEISDSYFQTRPYLSKIGAWASRQSEDIANYDIFLEKIETFKARFPEANNVPRPYHWGGYRLLPLSFEFWKEEDYRLHHRFLFKKRVFHDEWKKTYLYP